MPELGRFVIGCYMRFLVCCAKRISPTDPLGHVCCKIILKKVKMVINRLGPLFDVGYELLCLKGLHCRVWGWPGEHWPNVPCETVSCEGLIHEGNILIQASLHSETEWVCLSVSPNRSPFFIIINLRHRTSEKGPTVLGKCQEVLIRFATFQAGPLRTAGSVLAVLVASVGDKKFICLVKWTKNGSL